MTGLWTPDKAVVILPRGFRREDYERSRIARAPFRMPPRLRKQTPLQAAIALDTSVQGTISNAASITTAAMTTAGGSELLVAVLLQGGISDPTGVSDPGGGITWASRVTKTAASQYAQLWTGWTSGGLSGQTFTCSWTNNNAGLLTVAAFTGATNLDTKTPGTDFRVGSSGRTVSTTPAITLNTIGATGSFIFAGLQHWASNSWTPGTNTTTVGAGHIPGSGDMEIAMRTTAAVSAGNNTLQGTTDNEGWIMVATEILIASGSDTLMAQGLM